MVLAKQQAAGMPLQSLVAISLLASGLRPSLCKFLPTARVQLRSRGDAMDSLRAALDSTTPAVQVDSGSAGNLGTRKVTVDSPPTRDVQERAVVKANLRGTPLPACSKR